MRALMLILLLAGCAPVPPTTITPTEAKGLVMLHQMRAQYPDPPCRRECPCDR